MSKLNEIYKGNFAKRNKDGVITAYDGGYISYAEAPTSSQYLNTDGSGGVTGPTSGSPVLSNGMTPGQSNALNSPVNTSMPDVSLSTLPADANGNVASQQGGLGGALSGIGS